jgi:hypothetical protein
MIATQPTMNSIEALFILNRLAYTCSHLLEVTSARSTLASQERKLWVDSILR